MGHDHHHHDHQIIVTVPRFSLVRLSAAERMAGVGVLVLLLWSAVWWGLS